MKFMKFFDRDWEEVGNDIPTSSRLAIQMVAADISRYIPYAVIVECYDKKQFGRGKRRWLTEFDQKERARISKLYLVYYKWHLATGLPQFHNFIASDIELTVKAANFFASL